MLDVLGIRDGLVAVLEVAVPDVRVWRYPPDDLIDVPCIYVDLVTITGSLAISGGTALRFPVVVVSTRTDHEKAMDRLEDIAAHVWAALGDGKSVPLTNVGLRASCRSADPEQQSSAETTWPAMRFAVDVECGVTC